VRHLRTRRFFTIGGVLVGVGLAVVVEHWRRTALAQTPATGAEGVWWEGMFWAIVAGFPTNAFLAFLLELITGLAALLGTDPFYVFLLGVVANWYLIGSQVGKLALRSAWQKPRALEPRNPETSESIPR